MQDTYGTHQTGTLPYKGDHNKTYEELLTIVRNYDSCKITRKSHSTLHVHARRNLILADEIEFTFDDDNESILINSRLQFGNLDLGNGKKWFKRIKRNYLSQNSAWGSQIIWE